MLKNSKDTLGYTQQELKQICKERKIKLKDFNKAFGVNTCTIGDDGEPRYYKCDVERALYILGKKDGKYHEWD